MGVKKAKIKKRREKMNTSGYGGREWGLLKFSAAIDEVLEKGGPTTV